MKKLTITLAAFVALVARPALAQEANSDLGLHIAPFVGAYLPTGDQRDVLENGVLTGITVGYDVNPYLAVVGTFGWSPTKVKGVANSNLDLFQYDLGLQGQYPLPLGSGLVLKPFVGAGLGARTYSFRDLNVGSETDFSGYVAVGGTLQYRLVELTLTARDNISAYDGLGLSKDSTTRNDVGLTAAIGFRF